MFLSSNLGAFMLSNFVNCNFTLVPSGKEIKESNLKVKLPIVNSSPF